MNKQVSTFGFRYSTKNNGFVSIFSVLIIMAVLSLTLLGFSAVVRRAQITSLNDQLSTQAYYAAESGVNDVMAYLKTPGSHPDKPDCKATTDGAQPTGGPVNIDSALNVGYTCVLIKSSAPDIKFPSVPLQGVGNAKIVRFEASSGNIKSFNITLNSPSGAVDITNGSKGDLKPETSRSGDLGMLRVDLTPTSGSLDRRTLIENGYTFFLDFTKSGSFTSSYTILNGKESGELINPKCNPAPPCTTTITLNGKFASSYVMRLQSIYSPVSATIDKITNTTGGAVTLINGQKVIDVTGHASGVYRRIQVRLSSDDTGLTPAFVLESADSVCKLLQVKPGLVKDGCGDVPAGAPVGAPVGTPVGTPPLANCTSAKYLFDNNGMILTSTGVYFPTEQKLDVTPKITSCIGKIRLITRDDTHATTYCSSAAMLEPGCEWPGPTQSSERAFVVGCSDTSKCINTPAQTFITGVTADIPDTRSDVCEMKIFNIIVTADTSSIWFSHMVTYPDPSISSQVIVSEGNSVHGGSIEFLPANQPFPPAPPECKSY